MMEEGLSRKEAIDKLYEKVIGGKTPPAIQSQYEKYDGKLWGIYYLPISSFEDELPKLGETLDHRRRTMAWWWRLF